MSSGLSLVVVLFPLRRDDVDVDLDSVVRGSPGFRIMVDLFFVTTTTTIINNNIIIILSMERSLNEIRRLLLLLIIDDR